MHYLLIYLAYKGNKTKPSHLGEGFVSFVYLNENVLAKRFQKIFTRYDKLDIHYFFFVTLALFFNVLFFLFICEVKRKKSTKRKRKHAIVFYALTSVCLNG